MRRAVTIMLAVIVLGLASCGSDGPYGKTHANDELPRSVREKGTDVAYCNGAHMDIYRPKDSKRAAPAVLYAHGGGWAIGDKSSGSYVDQLVPALTKKGFVVATFNYRLGSKAPWPAQIRDAACAVRYLRAHRVELGIDPQRIGAWGGSAGGQLVSLLGTMDPAAGFDTGPYQDQSSRLQAVVDMYGPVDVAKFVAEYEGNADIEKTFGQIMASDPAGLRKASPATWATRNDPPFLIIQGEKDPIVHPSQSKTFASQLGDAGVSVRLVLVKNGTHGLAGEDIDPSRNDLIRMTIEFFQRHLMPDR